MRRLAIIAAALAAVCAPAVAQAGWTWDDAPPPQVCCDDGGQAWYCRQVDAFTIALYAYGQKVYEGPGYCY